MDAEEIAKMVKELRLAKETGETKVVITKEEAQRGAEKLEKTVVGRVFARRAVNKEILRLHVPKILRVRGGADIEIIGHNTFVASFSLASDRRVALEDGPWHFFQDLMIMKETNPMQSAAEVEFDHITLWAQCHNVPFACMEEDIIRRIGGQLGEVEEVDIGEAGVGFGSTPRVRVTRKLDKPLMKCVPIRHEQLENETLIIIQYEKLPHFCFRCGRIGHLWKDCEDADADKSQFSFDSRLRAGRTGPFRQMRSHERGGEEGRREGSFGGSRATGLGVRALGVRQTVQEEGGDDSRALVSQKEGFVGSNTGEREKGADRQGVVGGGGRTEIVRIYEDGDLELSDGNSMMELEKGNEGGQRGTGGRDEGVGKPSPGKSKKKGNDKKWRRRAREGLAKKRPETGNEVSLCLERVFNKRGGLDMEEEDLPAYAKQARLDMEDDLTLDTTAEVAVQPRRQQ